MPSHRTKPVNKKHSGSQSQATLSPKTPTAPVPAETPVSIPRVPAVPVRPKPVNPMVPLVTPSPATLSRPSIPSRVPSSDAVGPTDLQSPPENSKTQEALSPTESSSGSFIEWSPSPPPITQPTPTSTEPTQAAGSQSAIDNSGGVWCTASTTLFLTILLERRPQYDTGEGKFKSGIWSRVSRDLLDHGYSLVAKQCQNKYTTLKRRWEERTELLKQSGFGIDPDTKKVEVSDQVWEEWVRVSQFMTKKKGNPYTDLIFPSRLTLRRTGYGIRRMFFLILTL